MRSERWQEIDALFAAALEQPSAERRAFVRDKTNGDEELRRDVDALLAADESSFLEDSAASEVSRLLVREEQAKLIGRRVGRFVVLEPLGSGGMAEVFLGRDSELNREVALKFISPHLAQDPERVRRFRAEALAASGLNHPNIITVHEISDLDGRAVIVTEFVDGETLRERLRRGPLSFRDAAAIAIEIAGALDAAHRAGIVHRDIKPENIMIRADGRVKVVDFGIAKQHNILGDDHGGTRPGEVIGTIGYMSPEQARGVTVDARTDLWSLGVVLYEAVTGRMPFPGETATDRLAGIVSGEPASLGRGVPDSLERIIRRTLSKDRERRYGTAAELIADLQRLLAGGTVWRRKWVRPFAAAAVTAAVAVALFVPARRAATAPRVESLAVVPFVSSGGSAADVDLLSDGITASVINSLSQIPHVRVMSSNAVFRYKGRETDARQVGKDLDVSAVVSGRVALHGDVLAMSVELIDARDNHQMWGEQYRRPRADLLKLQDEISRDIVAKLRVRLTPEQKVRIEKQHTQNPEAYLLYLKGRLYWYKAVHEDYGKAEEFFKRAIEADPSYSLPHVGLADFYGFGASMGRFPPAEYWPKADEAMRRAQVLDPATAELQNTIAGGRVAFRDYAGAEEAFRRAIELNPNYAETYNNYSSYLGLMGRFDEALAMKQRAYAIDPLSVRYNSFLGETIFFARRYDDAIAQLRRTLEIDANDVRTHERLAESLAAKGMVRESIAEWAHVLTLTGDRATGARVPRVFEERGYAEAMKVVGNARLAQLEKRRARGEYIAPMRYVVPCIQIGDHDTALDWFDRASHEHSRLVLFAGVDPAFDPLRGDRRFKAILARLKLTNLGV